MEKSNVCVKVKHQSTSTVASYNLPRTQNFQVLIYLSPFPMRSCGLTQFLNSGCLPFGFYDSVMLYSVNSFLPHCICQIIN